MPNEATKFGYWFDVIRRQLAGVHQRMAAQGFSSLTRLSNGLMKELTSQPEARRLSANAGSSGADAEADRELDEDLLIKHDLDQQI